MSGPNKYKKKKKKNIYRVGWGKNPKTAKNRTQCICKYCFSGLKMAVVFRTMYMNSQAILENNKMNPQAERTPIAEQVEGRKLATSEAVHTDTYEPQFMNILSSNEILSDENPKEETEEIEYLDEYKDIINKDLLDTYLHEAVKWIEVDETVFKDFEQQKGDILEKENSNPSPDSLLKLFKSLPSAQESLPEENSHPKLNEPGQTVDISTETSEEQRNITYYCYLCDENFTIMEQLKGHIENDHSKDGPLKCYICNKNFKSIGSLQVHIHCHKKGGIKKSKPLKPLSLKPQKILEKKMNIEPFQCHICRTTCTDAESLQTHLVENHNMDHKSRPKVSTCILCDLTFSTQSGLIKHCNSVHQNAAFECQVCTKKFPKIEFYLTHQKTHVKNLNCRFCNKAFSNNDVLQRHERTHTGERPYLCDYCGKSFADKTVLSLHIRTHTNYRPYICTTCGKGFTSKGNLLNHAQKHVTNVPFECHICKKRFKTKFDISVHIRCHIKDKKALDDLKSHSSHICDKRFKHLQSLNGHLENHAMGRNVGGSNKTNGSNIKPYSCSECNTTFKYVQTLNLHLATHEEKREYPCDQCKKSFKSVSNLNNHMKGAHLKERPHICNICQKGFVLPSQLKHHVYKHTGEKPYKCDLCEKCYRVKANLKDHMRIKHTGKKSEECQICGERFSTNCQRYVHFAKH